MDAQILRNLGRLTGLGGIALGIFFLLFREVITQKLFPGLTQDQSFRIIVALMILTFGIAGIGLIAWLISLNSPAGDQVPEKPLYLLAALLLLVLSFTTVVILRTEASPLAPVAAKERRVCLGFGLTSDTCKGAIGFGCNELRNWTESRWDDVAKDVCGPSVKYSKTLEIQRDNRDGSACGQLVYLLRCTP